MKNTKRKNSKYKRNIKYNNTKRKNTKRKNTKRKNTRKNLSGAGKRNFSGFKINSKLSVQPSETDGESQWEAYQSIFAYIMNGDETSPYYKLLEKNGIHLLKTLRRNRSDPPLPDKYIYFRENDDNSTHFIAYLNGQELNPYNFYQAKDTQGFCQMFSYFLIIQDTNEFIHVNQDNQIKKETFNNLALNTQKCAEKSLALLNDNQEIYDLFKRDFNTIMITKRDKYGIKVGTTVEKYLNEFNELNKNLQNVKEYIVDQPLEGWPMDENKKQQKTYFMGI